MKERYIVIHSGKTNIASWNIHNFDGIYQEKDGVFFWRIVTLQVCSIVFLVRQVLHEDSFWFDIWRLRKCIVGNIKPSIHNLILYTHTPEQRTAGKNTLGFCKILTPLRKT